MSSLEHLHKISDTLFNDDLGLDHTNFHSLLEDLKKSKFNIDIQKQNLLYLTGMQMVFQTLLDLAQVPGNSNDNLGYFLFRNQKELF